MATVALSSCSSVRSSSSPTGSRASSPTSMPVTTASRRRSASKQTAPSPPGRSTTSPASAPIRSIRAPRASKRTRSSTSPAGPIPARTTRPRPRRLPEQERHVPVPRGRPSDRDRGHGGAGRARRRQDRHGPAGARRRNLIPDDAHPRAPSGIKFELSHHECLAHLDAMMNYAGLRAELKQPRAGHPSGHRVCLLHRGDQSERGVLRDRGAKISAQDGVTIKLDAGRDHLPDRRHRAGPRGRGGDRAGCGHGLRGADRARARHHRRYR